MTFLHKGIPMSFQIQIFLKKVTFQSLWVGGSCSLKVVEINEVGWSFPTEKLYNIDMALEFKRELPMSDDPQEVSKIYHENWVRN